MHHASAIKSPVSFQPLRQSPAAARQPLGDVHLNQQQPDLQLGTSSNKLSGTDHAAEELQADGFLTVSTPTKQLQPWSQQRMRFPEQQVQEAKKEEAVRAGCQQAPVQSTARQLQEQQQQQTDLLRHGGLQYEQLSDSLQHHYAGSPNVGCVDAVVSTHVANTQDCAHMLPDSLHAEKLQIVAQMLEPIATSASGWQLPSGAPAAALHMRSLTASHAPSLTPAMHHSRGTLQAGTVDLDSNSCQAVGLSHHMVHSASAIPSRHVEAYAEHVLYSQRLTAAQQTTLDPHLHSEHYAGADAAVQSIQKQDRPARLLSDASELPVGIPLTPVLSRQPQPRDSLEASIWKLSSSNPKQHKSALSANCPSNAGMRRALNAYDIEQHLQQPGVDNKSLHMVCDSLEATLQNLAARQ